MPNNEKPNVKKLLEIGIRSEIESQKVYEEMTGREKIPKYLERKINFVKKEEKEHEEKLRKMFSQEFPEKEPDLPKESEKPAPEEADLKGKESSWWRLIWPFSGSEMNMKSVTINKLFKKAMKSEKESKEFYENLGNELEDQESRELARTLAHMEEGHYNTLEHELESLEETLLTSKTKL